MTLVGYAEKMAVKTNQLIQLLAKTRVGLSEPERKLLQKVIEGEEADYSADDDALNDPANFAEWAQNRTLSAPLIVWLCTDPEASSRLTHRGLSIVGAKIEGSLNLQFANLEFPLIFRRCAFTETIRLEQAKVKFFDLSGSSLDLSLEASGIQVESDVLLCNGFKVIGQVSLVGATIGGNLDCNNGTFDNPEGHALLAESAEVKGFVFLHNGFKVIGQVSLYRATIGGNLECDNSTFYNPEGYALLAQGTEIKGSVFLRDGFKATGEVSLSGITIGGNLSCYNGTFDNPKGTALLADSAEIKGAVFLNGGFKTKGVVNFMNATIDDTFVLSKVRDPDEMGLDLRFATIRTLADQGNSWPQSGNLFLDGLVYDKIDRSSPSDDKSRLQWLRLQASHVFSPQPYEQLAQVLKASGHEEAATEVLIGKQG